MLDGFAINVLRVFRQQPLKVLWKIHVALIRHHGARKTRTRGGLPKRQDALRSRQLGGLSWELIFS